MATIDAAAFCYAENGGAIIFCWTGAIDAHREAVFMVACGASWVACGTISTSAVALTEATTREIRAFFAGFETGFESVGTGGSVVNAGARVDWVYS